MKAYVLHKIGKLIYEEVELPDIKPGWVLVEVQAAGICGSDIPRVFETGTYHFPTIPGHEFSGIVRFGSSTEDDEWIGKRVGVFPLIPCKKCTCCISENYEMCENYNYLGSRTDGGFAEYVVVPKWNLIELPSEVSFEDAAMLEPMAVALHALKQLPIEKISSIAIYGAGPIGFLMAQWARTLGIHKVLIIANKQKQIELAQKMEFYQVCNSKVDDPVKWILEQTDGIGVDASMDVVGTCEVLEQCIKSVKPKGSIITVGNPREDISLDKNVYWRILRKQLRVFGTWNSSFGTVQNDDWKQSVEALKTSEISTQFLITHRLNFENLQEGMLIMKNKSEFYCKVMIVKG